jgi:hypothetical protein
LVLSRELVFVARPWDASTAGPLSYSSAPHTPEQVDQVSNGEDGHVAGEDDRCDRHHDEEGLEDEILLCEEGQTEVDEDEVLRKLEGSMAEEGGQLLR